MSISTIKEPSALKMDQELQRHIFKTDMSSVYQRFWFTFDILKISPKTEVDFCPNGVMTISTCNLSYHQIQLILIEHTVEFEKIS